AQTEKKSIAEVKPANTAARGLETRKATPRNTLQRVGAPSIRFPKPELRDNGPTPSPESRIRNYSSSHAARVNVSRPSFARVSSLSPKFYRAADGTQIV